MSDECDQCHEHVFETNIILFNIGIRTQYCSIQRLQDAVNELVGENLNDQYSICLL